MIRLYKQQLNGQREVEISNAESDSITVLKAAKVIFLTFGKNHVLYDYDDFAKFCHLDISKTTDDEWDVIEGHFYKLERRVVSYFTLEDLLLYVE